MPVANLADALFENANDAPYDLAKFVITASEVRGPVRDGVLGRQASDGEEGQEQPHGERLDPFPCYVPSCGLRPELQVYQLN